jgi:hypothetical protein
MKGQWVSVQLAAWFRTAVTAPKGSSIKGKCNTIWLRGDKQKKGAYIYSCKHLVMKYGDA